MRIGMTTAESVRKTSVTDTDIRRRGFSKIGSDTVRKNNQGEIASNYSFLQQLEEEAEKKKGGLTVEAAQEAPSDRSEAAKICEAALKGSENPLSNVRSTPKVPYGYLAKDGVITYNGVQFICDEKTNSICLGDMTNRKQVINIPLSDGGHLKVNRANLGQLSKAIGMFSPEDLNLILRAIHLDTKLQSIQKEVEDLEAGVGEEIASGDSAARTDENT